MVFLVLLCIPLLVAGAGFFLSKGLVTRKELALQVGVQAVVAAVAAFLVHYSSVHDTEVWNGVVVSKSSEHVSCSHSYQCHCHESCSGSGKNRSCSEVCDTCYEHSYDVDWNVYTSNAEKITIERVDRQGTTEPGRYSAVVMGEPTTLPHGYTNYIKAAPGTLFRHQGLTEKFKSFIPEYPDDLYDYYHVNKLVTVDVHVDDAKGWNLALEKLNAEVGRPKQANVIVVLVRNQPQEYFYALEEAWIGAKKNDIVLVVGLDDLLQPQWATVMCWTTQEMFKVKLRDDIMAEGGKLDRDKVMADLKKDVVQYYVRKPMADFEYLEASITPTPAQWAVSLVISIIIAIVLTIVGIKYDIFGDERRARLYAEENSLFSKLGIQSSVRSRYARRKAKW